MKYIICITVVFVVVIVDVAFVVFVVLNQRQRHRFLTAITFELYPDTCSFVTRQ
jgi:hypothetical protein